MSGKQNKSGNRLGKALDQLAGLFEWGELHMATDPASFINALCDEILYYRTLIGMKTKDAAGKTICPFFSQQDDPRAFGTPEETKAAKQKAIDQAFKEYQSK